MRMADDVETKYARSGDVFIAYQVSGSGPLDIVMVPGFISNVETGWSNPQLAYFFRRLGSFARLIRFDKRGTGLSDRMAEIASLEQRLDDVRAVMDAAGSTRAAILGMSEGGAMSMLFATTYPERVQALALFGAYAHFPTHVLGPDELRDQLREIETDWGTGRSLRRFAPSVIDDPQALARWAAFERTGGSPSAVISLLRMNAEIDVRHILPAIRVPTLVAHRRDDTRVKFAAAEEIAGLIPAARLLALVGRDHSYQVGEVDPLLGAIEEFLTGAQSSPDPDRVLKTVMFADIVGSTEKVRTLGDRRWRSLLKDFFVATGDTVRRYMGHQVKTTGDGLLAIFDGPARGVQCAAAIRSLSGAYGFQVRCGLHTGEIELLGDDVGGIAVHIASRVADRAAPNQVLVPTFHLG